MDDINDSNAAGEKAKPLQDESIVRCGKAITVVDKNSLNDGNLAVGEVVLENVISCGHVLPTCDKSVQADMPILASSRYIDTLSRTNNHPGDTEPDQDEDDASKTAASLASLSLGRFGDAGTLEINGKKYRSRSRHSLSIIKANQTFYLAPIGSLLDVEQPPYRWMDVSQVLDSGTAKHRSVDPHKAAKNITLTTLSGSGLLTSEMCKMKSYTLRSITPAMMRFNELLQANAEKRIFTETHAKFMCVNVLMAVRFLHQHDIAHSYLGPKAIIINEKGYPCLTDLGLAQCSEDRQGRHRRLQPLEYSSPDHVYRNYLLEDSDIFCLGTIVFDIIHGRPPHRGKTDTETRKNVIDMTFEPTFGPEKLSNEGQQFIKKCLRKSHRRRFSVLQKANFFDAVPWFKYLHEDKLYKQTLPSPMLPIIKTYRHDNIAA